MRARIGPISACRQPSTGWSTTPVSTSTARRWPPTPQISRRPLEPVGKFLQLGAGASTAAFVGPAGVATAWL